MLKTSRLDASQKISLYEGRDALMIFNCACSKVIAQIGRSVFPQYIPSSDSTCMQITSEAGLNDPMCIFKL